MGLYSFHTIYAQISIVMSIKAQISVIMTSGVKKFGVYDLDIILHASIFRTCYIPAEIYRYDCNSYEFGIYETKESMYFLQGIQEQHSQIVHFQLWFFSPV